MDKIILKTMVLPQSGGESQGDKARKGRMVIMADPTEKIRLVLLFFASILFYHTSKIGGKQIGSGLFDPY
jgi:hypothetical protein